MFGIRPANRSRCLRAAAGALIAVAGAGCDPGLPALLDERGHPPAAQPSFVPWQIGFWTVRRGIAVARNGRSVAITDDGGRSWRVVRGDDHGRLASLTVSGARTAAALGSCSARFGCQALWRSRDGGRTWSSAPLPRRLYGIAPARRDPELLWAVASPPGAHLRVMSSASAGLRWRPVTTPCPPSWDGEALAAVTDDHHAWVMCTTQPGAGAQGKQLWSSADDGRHWRRLVDIDLGGRRRRLSGGLSASGYPTAASFTAAGAGLLTMSRGFAYRTSDGGRSWHPVPRITEPDAREGFSPCQISRTVAYLLVYQPGVTLYRSSDGDRHWTTIRHWTTS